MVVYFFFFFLILFFSLNKKVGRTKSLDIILLVILCIFLCMGYMTGSDWRQYEPQYNSLTLTEFFSNNNSLEFGYVFFQMIFKSIGFSFWYFFITTKILCFIISINVLRRFSNVNYHWSLLMFFSIFALDAYIDNPMRNLIASVIFLFSFKFILNNNFFKYLIIIIVASTFHMSALFMIPLYLIRKININYKTIIIILCFLITIITVFQAYFREILLFWFWEFGGIFAERFNPVYLHEALNLKTGRTITIGFIVHYLVFVLILIKKKQIESKENGRLLFNFTFVYMIFYTIAFSIWILFRMRLYVFLPFCICAGFIPSLYHKWYFKLPAMSLIIILSFFTMNSLIKGSYKYIPYTNYLFEPNINFYKRSNYNFINSPYLNDEFRKK